MITVVIPTYQRSERVRKAIASVLRQVRPADEVVVVDDGSTDGTAEALAGFGDAIRLIRLAANGGVSHARNVGVAEAAHRWIALLDSDDVWEPDHLQSLCEHLDDDPDCRIVQTRELWYRKGRRVNPKRYHVPPTGDIFEPSLRRCLVSSSAVLLEKSLFESAGAYDERMPVCEDYDLWLRIAREHPVGLVDRETVVKDGGRGDQLSRRFWGMDRFRCFALAKLLVHGLSEEQHGQVRAVYLAKLDILEAGAAKRGEPQSVAAYRRWRDAADRSDVLKALVAKPGGLRPDPIVEGLLETHT
jgi:glycosyltransferase involved in cell wall biosynthesis